MSSETGEGIEKLVEQLRLNVEIRHGIYSAFAYSGSTSCGVARLFVGLIRVSTGRREELAAEDLRLAVRALGKITGRVDVEDVPRYHF